VLSSFVGHSREAHLDAGKSRAKVLKPVLCAGIRKAPFPGPFK
jgi:hypothetical protein